jgi:hypothetical protein
VAAHVTDHQVDGAVEGLDGVVEVTAEQRPPPAGPVAGVVAQRGVLQLGHREQAACQAGVLPAEEAGLDEFALGLVGALALDGVPHGARQQGRVDLLLDQVVLSARSHGGDADLGVAEAGQHQHGGARRQPEHLAQHVEAVRVRQ